MWEVREKEKKRGCCVKEERNGGERDVQGRTFYEGTLRAEAFKKNLAVLHSLWDLISQTSNRTHIPCIGRQSQPLDHQGSLA